MCVKGVEFSSFCTIFRSLNNIIYMRDRLLFYYQGVENP